MTEESLPDDPKHKPTLSPSEEARAKVGLLPSPAELEDSGKGVKAAIAEHQKGKSELVVVQHRPLTALERAQQAAAEETGKLAKVQREHLESEEIEAQNKESKERLGTLEYNQPRARGLLISKAEAEKRKAKEELALKKEESKTMLAKRKQAVEEYKEKRPSKFKKTVQKLARTGPISHEPSALGTSTITLAASIPSGRKRQLMAELDSDFDSSKLAELIQWNPSSTYVPFGYHGSSTEYAKEHRHRAELQAVALERLEGIRFEELEARGAKQFAAAAGHNAYLLDKKLTGRFSK